MTIYQIHIELDGEEPSVDQFYYEDLNQAKQRASELLVDQIPDPDEVGCDSEGWDIPLPEDVIWTKGGFGSLLGWTMTARIVTLLKG